MSPQKRAFFDVSFAGMIVALPLLTWYFAIAIVHYDAALVWKCPIDGKVTAADRLSLCVFR